MRLLSLFLALGLFACPASGGSDDDDATSDDDDATADDDDATGDDDDAAAASCGADWAVVNFGTEDGVVLEADWKPAPAANAGAVVLFHMAPPTNDRAGYPLRVRDALAAEGVAVLNVDRRGAGGSTGSAPDATQGLGPLLDMQASLGFVLDALRECTVDPDKLVLVGASNGTTAVYDYTVGHRDGFPTPAANILLSPGGYTETNNAFPTTQANWPVDLAFPFLWLYPTSEPYSGGFEADAPASWRFVEDGSAHGTSMFDGGGLEDRTVAEMAAWIRAVQ